MRAGGLLRVSPEDRQRKGAGEKGQGGMVPGAVGNAEKWTPNRRGFKLPDRRVLRGACLIQCPPEWVSRLRMFLLITILIFSEFLG